MEFETYDPTVGALEIGVMIAVFLFGLVTVQTFSYYKKFPNDPLTLRLFVAFIWFLELAHNILGVHTVYWVSVTKYGRPEYLDIFPTSCCIAVFLSGLIGPATQAFFANRVRTLSRTWFLPIVIWFLCFLRFLSLFGVAATTFTTATITEFKTKFRWLLAASLGISTAVDVLIACSLCWFLWQSRRTTPFKGTRRMVDLLMVWSIQTGLVTSMASTVMLFLFIFVSNLAWLAVFFILSRLFSNSLLATLNARASLRNIHINNLESYGTTFEDNIRMARGHSTFGMTDVLPQSMTPTTITIEVSSTTHRRTDDDSDSSDTKHYPAQLNPRNSIDKLPLRM